MTTRQDEIETYSPAKNGRVSGGVVQLPGRAMNLAQRALSEMAKGNGRMSIEIVEAPDGSWIAFVNDGKREILGK